MKIILINPPSPFEKEPAMNPPLGLCYISAYAKLCGYIDITLIDYSLYKYDYLNETDYLEKIPLDADVYGITCVTPQYKWLHDITAYIRGRNEKAVIVAGGPHPTNCAEECMKECSLDYIIRGEGEFAFIRVLKMIEDHKNSPKIINHSFCNNLDKLPFPDRSLLLNNEYKREIDGQKAAHIVTLRGCSYSCRYCDKSSGNKIRYRSIENVIEEVEQLRVYNINALIIYDDIFTCDVVRVKEFCKYTKCNSVKWRCFSRVDKLNYELLQIMKDSGLTSITLGVESGDDTILKNINKRATVKQNKEAILNAKKNGVPVRCSLMYGNPGENKETLINTIKFIEETQPDEWNLAILTPIPGSAFWNEPEKHGISFNKLWLKKQQYLVCNRFADTGIGRSYISISTMTDKEFQLNLAWFISELERVCPRKKIQDTIQDIKI